MISDDKYIEILAAAFQRATIPDADIEWNVNLGNRQFDVIAKLQAGMHTILLGFEVKNKSRPISVDAVDAFVTKARDAGINKLVFVSTSGFQKGAISVAKRHNVDLFKLELLPDDIPRLNEGASLLILSNNEREIMPDLKINIIDDDYLMNNVDEIQIVYTDGSVQNLPDEPSQMNYYCDMTIFDGGKSLSDVINDLANKPVPLEKFKIYEITSPGNISPPDEFFFKSGKVRKIIMKVRGIKGKLVSSDVDFEITSVKHNVKYTDVISGNSQVVPAYLLPTGSEPFQAGSFYFAINPLRYYFCEQVSNGVAKIHLVESFQSSKLFQVSFTQEAEFGKFTMKLNDTKIINRLKQRWEKMKSSSEEIKAPKTFPFLRSNILGEMK